jgi:hypothetical protein
MNVLYVKVENKITVSVPGYSASQVTARAKDGSSCTPVNKNKGEWLVTPIKENRKNAPFIQLFVTDDGKKKSMGWVEFRILDVPKPEAQAAGIDKDITIVSRDELKGAQMLKATLGEDFLLDPKAVQFGITGFEVEYSNSNGNFVAKQKNGATFNKDVEQAIATTSAGGLMRFTNIKAKRRGYKKVYPLKPLTFKIK